MSKIYLGTIKKEIEDTQSYKKAKNNLSFLGETISIKKHTWDCGSYWGFGYIGNNRLHTHSNVFIEELLFSDVSNVFEKSIFRNDADFWIFKDLLIQAYALQKTAEVYKHGGHCSSVAGTTDILISKEKASLINKDLEIILNSLWNFLTYLSDVQ